MHVPATAPTWSAVAAMLGTDVHARLAAALLDRTREDMAVLQALRVEIAGLRTQVRQINRCTTTAVSLVAADGGNNQIGFDPFLVQVARVVDSNNNAYCVEAVTASTDIAQLGRAQFDTNGTPCTPLGEMMAHLGVVDLPGLSHMIRPAAAGRPINAGWVRAYRELIEWAVLFHIVSTRDFATDTIIVRDGLLRSLCFAGDLFTRLRAGFVQRIDEQRSRHNRRIYLAGVAKHSKVLDRYRLAMLLEGVLTTPYPAYVEVPPRDRGTGLHPRRVCAGQRHHR